MLVLSTLSNTDLRVFFDAASPLLIRSGVACRVAGVAGRDSLNRTVNGFRAADASSITGLMRVLTGGRAAGVLGPARCS